MAWFLTGIAVVYSVLAAWAIRSGPEYGGQQLVLVATLAGLPVSAAWLVGEVFLRISPRRAFDPRQRRPLALVAAGLVAGVASALFSTALLGVLTGYEVTVLGGCSAGFAVLVLGRFSRSRAGTCVHCHYNLTGTGGIRCPECGSVCSRIGPPHPAVGACEEPIG